MEIKVGLEIFLRPTGNLIRRGLKVKRGKVTKIGRKYFYVDDEKFGIETMKNINDDCNSAWIIYFSEQEIIDEEEKKRLWNEFCKMFQ